MVDQIKSASRGRSFNWRQYLEIHCSITSHKMSKSIKHTHLQWLHWTGLSQLAFEKDLRSPWFIQSMSTDHISHHPLHSKQFKDFLPHYTLSFTKNQPIIAKLYIPLKLQSCATLHLITSINCNFFHQKNVFTKHCTWRCFLCISVLRGKREENSASSMRYPLTSISFGPANGLCHLKIRLVPAWKFLGLDPCIVNKLSLGPGQKAWKTPILLSLTSQTHTLKR